MVVNVTGTWAHRLKPSLGQLHAPPLNGSAGERSGAPLFPREAACAVPVHRRVVTCCISADATAVIVSRSQHKTIKAISPMVRWHRLRRPRREGECDPEINQSKGSRTRVFDRPARHERIFGPFIQKSGTHFFWGTAAADFRAARPPAPAGQNARHGQPVRW